MPNAQLLNYRGLIVGLLSSHPFQSPPRVHGLKVFVRTIGDSTGLPPYAVAQVLARAHSHPLLPAIWSAVPLLELVQLAREANSLRFVGANKTLLLPLRSPSCG